MFGWSSLRNDLAWPLGFGVGIKEECAAQGSGLQHGSGYVLLLLNCPLAALL